MACSGCSRNKKNSGTRKRSIIKQVPGVKQNLKSLGDISPSILSIRLTSDILKRIKICNKCSFFIFSSNLEFCKKTKLSVKKALSDPNFKCPIALF